MAHFSGSILKIPTLTAVAIVKQATTCRASAALRLAFKNCDEIIRLLHLTVVVGRIRLFQVSTLSNHFHTDQTRGSDAPKEGITIRSVRQQVVRILQ